MAIIKWAKYTDQIIELSTRGMNSSEILGVLKESSKELNANLISDPTRGIRRVINKHKKAVSTIKDELSTNNKVLLFDLETAPLIGYMWSKWQKGIHDDMIISDWFVFSWAAKWLFEDEVLSDRLTQEELNNKDDKRIVKNLWELIDEAEVIIAHNLKKFDEKKIKTRFLQYDMNPPSPYQTIDTLLHARKNFSITSNRLDYIADRFFSIEGKMETPRGLWWKCMEGDYESLILMDDYCKQDVRVLEDVYLHLRPWISPHPNLALLSMSNNGGCPACLSEEREYTKTNYNTYVNSYLSYRCKDCGHIYRERKSSTPLSSNANLKVSTPR